MTWGRTSEVSNAHRPPASSIISGTALGWTTTKPTLAGPPLPPAVVGLARTAGAAQQGQRQARHGEQSGEGAIRNHPPPLEAG